MSLQSALIGFLLSRLLGSPMTTHEIIVVQTTAVATGTMPLAAGFVGVLPALSLLDKDLDGSPPVHLSWFGAAAWSCAVAYFGFVTMLCHLLCHSSSFYLLSVFLSPPIRKQVVRQSSFLHTCIQIPFSHRDQIIKEKLAFPSGTATAQLISVLHRLPPATDPALRRRHGYNPIDTNEAPLESEQELIDEAEQTDHEPVPPSTSWRFLLWSFLASGSMTVRQ
jgi:uncharacterized oligopeptide transporter (OPT) family protein